MLSAKSGQAQDGRRLVSAGYFMTAVWDVETGEQVAFLSNATMTTVAWSPDSRYVAVGAANNSRAITIWDIQKGTLLNTLLGHTDNIYSVQWSPFACHLASGGRDGAPRLWGCPEQ